MILRLSPLCFFFFFNDTATTEIYTLSLHDALPIYYLELLRRAGWIDSLLDEPSITLYASEQNRRSAAEFLVASGARRDSLRIAIGAGASYGSAKCWPPSRFAELANRLQERTDADVILFGTASEG